MLVLLASLAPLLTRVLCAFGGEDPVKGDPWYHEELTWHAAAAAGWSTGTGQVDDGSAAAALAWHADYVDSYLYNPAWWAAGGFGRFKAALLLHDELVKVHFDDLTSAEQIARTWRRVLGGTVAGIVWAAQRRDGGDVDAARHVVGVGLHALQDFYSHSSWLDAPERRALSWVDAAEALGDGGRDGLHLYTGTYELPDHLGYKPHGKIAFDCFLLRQVVGAGFMDVLCSGWSPLSGTGLCHRWRECASSAVPGRPRTVLGVPLPENIVWIEPPGIALDSTWIAAISVQQRDLPDGVGSLELFQQALALAERHSTQWLLQLEAIVSAAGLAGFWASVKTAPRSGERTVPDLPLLASYLGGYRGDLDEYEKASKLHLTFVSAGSYPPSPTEPDDGWFLRLELTTASTFGAGTNAHVYAEVDGRDHLLDHMHGRDPGGGIGEWRILEFNDFEAGDHTAYVVGPFVTRPTSLVLRNSGANALDIVAGAWEDLKRGASRAIEVLGDILLSLIGGHADYVASDKRELSWAELVAIAGGPGQTFTMYCDGGGEGNYRVTGIVTSVLTDTGAEVSVRLTRLIAVEESDWDRGSSSDEPFVQLLVQSPASDQLEARRVGPFSDVDSRESREIHMAAVRVSVPRYGGIIVPLQVWESDDEGEGGRDKLLGEFASRWGDALTDERSRFLDAIGAAVAPDWRLATVDVFAFRRGDTVETARLVRTRPVNRWVDAGTRLPIPFDAATTASVRLDVPVPVVPVDGTLLREDSGAIWVVYGGARFHVPDPGTFHRLFDSGRLRQVDSAVVHGVSRVPADGTLLREESGAIFVIYGGAYFGVPSMEVFTRFFGQRGAGQLWNGALGHLRSRPVDGTLLREESGAIVVVYGGARFQVPDPATFHRLFDPSRLRQLWDGATAWYPTVPVDGTLLREGEGAQVWVVRQGRRSPAPTGAAGAGTLWPGALAHIPTG